MHQNNRTSVILDSTPSRFIKSTPNMVLKCIRIQLSISEIKYTYFGIGLK
jgi:hypothetical protein